MILQSSALNAIMRNFCCYHCTVLNITHFFSPSTSIIHHNSIPKDIKYRTCKTEQKTIKETFKGGLNGEVCENSYDERRKLFLRRIFLYLWTHTANLHLKFYHIGRKKVLKLLQYLQENISLFDPELVKNENQSRIFFRF